jgi:pyruvate dehydrogenase E2 component (dihydrolipoamide acetyltransferase)
MAVEVIMPKIDEAMTEGKILEWQVQEGADVIKGMTLFVIETEKVTWEVESPAAGILSPHLAAVGDVVPVGKVVAYVLAEGEAMPVSDEVSLSPQSQKPSSEPAEAPAVAATVAVSTSPTAGGEARIRATPLAKKLAREKSLDLSLVVGSGPSGRIKRQDVEKYLEVQEARSSAGPPDAPPEKPLDEPLFETVVPLSSMRKTIARRMTASFQSAPHFFLTVATDMTALKDLRQELLPTILEQTGIRLTFTDLFVKIVARAVEDNPSINTFWNQDNLGVHAAINIGIAVNVENGLVVPVLKQANVQSLAKIAQQREDLVQRARAGKLLPSEMKSGSLTISNLGMFGIDQFNPIINPPESCILGLGQIKDQPVAAGAEIVIRPMLNMTLSIDHRVLDGGLGSRFLQRIVQLIERPLLMI